jgi:hypothetical protein
MRYWLQVYGSRFLQPGSTRLEHSNTTSPSSLHDQHTRNSRKVGREDEGVSSTRPEMVALTECLEDHGDDISLLYLTDSEAILQAIHRWIGYGSNLNLLKSPDEDVLKKIIIKLQKRVLAGAATLLVKVNLTGGTLSTRKQTPGQKWDDTKKSRSLMERPN